MRTPHPSEPQNPHHGTPTLTEHRTPTNHYGTRHCAEARMRRTDPEDHGPVRFGPPLPDDGLPVLP
ncbi:hypothetical protein, partial [Streptomyces sp. T21Q-yed]|uniref:hypothetical protein n=1 Tax=Streptomyces sp. T21Q-yed TaxID=3018441 RepID=UPI0023DEF517